MYKKLVLFLAVVIFAIGFSQSVQILVKNVEASFPDSLFKSTGSKTFNVQYIKLFSDAEAKGYIIKAWYFQPGTGTMVFKVRLVDEKNKKEYSYDFQGIRDKSYVRLKNVLVICPSNFKIYVNNEVIPEEKAVGSEIVIPEPVGEVGDKMLKILQRTASGFMEIPENAAASKDEEVIVQIIAGTFPTGGYRIELDEPDIIFPMTGKRGKITITGTFYRPGKGDMVTQAFTTPTKSVSLGKLPAGEYDLYINVKDLGEFYRTLVVK